MTTYQKSINLIQMTLKSIQNLPDTKQLQISSSNQIKLNSSNLKFQTSHERAELIRSNKNILKRHLKNSLHIQKPRIPLNLKQENLTAASLKDLESDQYLALKKNSWQKSSSSIGSSKLFTLSINKIMEETFEDKYQVIKKIGQGAHSTVYKTVCKVDNKLYALKKIKNVSFQNWKKMKNLFRLVKSLNHQNIIKYHQFYFDEQKRTAYIVMEYCQFKDLRQEITKRQINGEYFSKKELMSIIKQVSSVLQHLHSQGICHRDLKPENILYCKQEGKLKVIDLDVCGVKIRRNQNFDLWTNTGTLLYRAPQTFEIGYSQKADIWSLGTIIYELITGEVPFQTEYEKDFLIRIRNEEVNLGRVELSERIKYILERCLKKEVRERISASQLSEFCFNKIKDDFFVKKGENMKMDVKEKSWDDFHSSNICLGGLLKLSQ